MKRNSTLTILPATATHLVLPEQLAQQAADAVRELLAEAAAANTTRSYATALRYWAGCCTHRFLHISRGDHAQLMCKTMLSVRPPQSSVRSVHHLRTTVLSDHLGAVNCAQCHASAV